MGYKPSLRALDRGGFWAQDHFHHSTGGHSVKDGGQECPPHWSNGVGGKMRCIRKADRNVRPTRRVGAMLAVQAAALAGAANLWAGIAFDPTTSTLRITHD